jgi:hypothetical protein
MFTFPNLNLYSHTLQDSRFSLGLVGQRSSNSEEGEGSDKVSK